MAAIVVTGGFGTLGRAVVAEPTARVAEAVGGIAGLKGAGGFTWELMGSGTLESRQRMYRVSLLNATVATGAALPHLTRSGCAIVNIGAAGAAKSGAGMAPYAASKAGVREMAENLAEEYRGKGLRVNSVLPTIIDTPVNRADMPDADTAGWMKPEAAAKVIAFLLSGDTGAITGASIPLSLACG